MCWPGLVFSKSGLGDTASCEASGSAALRQGRGLVRPSPLWDCRTSLSPQREPRQLTAVTLAPHPGPPQLPVSSLSLHVCLLGNVHIRAVVPHEASGSGFSLQACGICRRLFPKIAPRSSPKSSSVTSPIRPGVSFLRSWALGRPYHPQALEGAMGCPSPCPHHCTPGSRLRQAGLQLVCTLCGIPRALWFPSPLHPPRPSASVPYQPSDQEEGREWAQPGVSSRLVWSFKLTNP